MLKLLHYGVRRWIARLLAPLCLLMWHAPPVGAFRPPPQPRRTQTTTPELREKIARHEARAAWGARSKEQGARSKEQRARSKDGRELTPAEMTNIRARGPKRNRYFNGVLPWQRSLRDVNLANGNLFKSFTDIQVPPARGAGLAFQRTYNSSDDRPGPFGIGWTNAYDIRVEEAGSDNVARTDFFGGKHTYHRDADGLYSPPPYLFDEMSSEYSAFLVSGPQTVLSDEQRGMDGTVKHFFTNGPERACDYIEDRHGNRTLLTYGYAALDRMLLSRVTDPSGRYLEMSWTNFGTPTAPIYRITQVQGPFDPGTGQPVYTVLYEYL